MDSFEVKIFLSESKVGALNTEKALVGSVSKCCVTNKVDTTNRCEALKEVAY